MAKKYIDAELLKKGLKELESVIYSDQLVGQSMHPYDGGQLHAIKVVKELIDSLQQEQSCDTCTNDKGCVTCKDGELWEGKEQSSEDLEKEIKTWIPAHIVGGDKAPWKELKDVVIQWAGIVARHFYILGLKNNIPVTQITLAELAKEGELVSKDLEEAAEEYCIKCNYGLDSLESDTAIDAFKAGAKWQEKQMPMPEDTVIFQKGIEEGKRLMVEDAVEGYVNYYEDSGGILMAEAQVGCPYHNGDKVKIVIVKED